MRSLKLRVRWIVDRCDDSDDHQCPVAAGTWVVVSRQIDEMLENPSHHLWPSVASNIARGTVAACRKPLPEPEPADIVEAKHDAAVRRDVEIDKAIDDLSGLPVWKPHSGPVYDKPVTWIDGPYHFRASPETEDFSQMQRPYIAPTPQPYIAPTPRNETVSLEGKLETLRSAGWQEPIKKLDAVWYAVIATVVVLFAFAVFIVRRNAL